MKWSDVRKVIVVQILYNEGISFNGNNEYLAYKSQKPSNHFDDIYREHINVERKYLFETYPGKYCGSQQLFENIIIILFPSSLKLTIYKTISACSRILLENRQVFGHF